MKIGDKVKSKSKYHQRKTFEVVFIEDGEITCLYEASLPKNTYRLITTEDRLIVLK